MKVDLDETEDVILDESDLEKLLTNTSITKKLKNKKLRRIIKLINASKFKNSLLDKTSKHDKHFKDFTEEILETLGIKKGKIVDI